MKMQKFNSEAEAKVYLEELRSQIHKWDYEYYVLNNPTIDDLTYDKKMQELKELEEIYPQFYDPTSPTLRVGGEVSEKFIKRMHNEPMLSLNNSYNVADIQTFYNNILEQTKQQEVEFVCEPKIDGLSISCIYQNGKFQYALTRGDGKFGEDVSNNVKTISNVPLSIPYQGMLEVRGEVYLPKHVLLELNKDGQVNFMNTRNTASGALRNLDPKVTKSRKLSAWFYYVPQYLNLNFRYHYDILKFLHDEHFPVALNEIKKVKGIKGILEYIDAFDKRRGELDYDVDGVVIKVNDRSLYGMLGTTSKFPKYAIAYKYQPIIGQTRLLDIITTVGRTGKINFTAKLEPIKIAGSTITYATLHNADYIQERDIEINDYVNIYKAAEVIPKISSPILKLRDKTVHPFTIPTTCPACGSLLQKNENEVELYCLNPLCKEKIIQQLIYYCSKDALDIEGLSEATIRKFFKYNLLNNILDFYKLKDHYDEIINLDLHIKNKMLNKILENIEQSKNLSLEHILTALGIKYVGQTTAKTLAEQFKSIDAIISASLLELTEVKDVGEKVAQSIYDFFQDKDNLELIEHLKQENVNLLYKEDIRHELADVNSPYFHKKFAITGKFSISRDDLIKLIEQKYLGVVVSSVTKNTDFLVLGEKPSSKLEKAEELRIKIISEGDL